MSVNDIVKLFVVAVEWEAPFVADPLGTKFSFKVGARQPSFDPSKKMKQFSPCYKLNATLVHLL